MVQLAPIAVCRLDWKSGLCVDKDRNGRFTSMIRYLYNIVKKAT